MIFAILTSLLHSFSDILWKKTLINRLPEYLNSLFGYSTGVLFAIYFVFKVDFSQVDYVLFILIFLMSSLDIIKSKISQLIYREEKISVLMPYTNINKILTIIVSFFIFSDVSVKTLIITIFTIIIIILFSIDFKTIKFPRNILKMFFVQGLYTITNLLIGYMVINYGEGLLFIFDVGMGTSILILLSFYFGYFSQIKQINKNYYLPRLTGSFLGWGGYAISLLIISDLGLSVSILLGFIGMGITLLLSFLILKDKPLKKDLLLTIIVTTLVGIGFYLK